MGEVKTEGSVTVAEQKESPDSREHVEGYREDVTRNVKSEASLSQKVEELRDNIDVMSEEAQSKRSWPRDDYLGTLEQLRAQVESIQKDWDSVSTHMKAERDKVESLLQSFPGIIEISTLHAQSLRLNHLEQLVSELFQELHTKKSEDRTKKQMIISLVALGVTVVLWGVWIAVAILK
jgi:chromosome segregation ATPase